MLKGKATFKTTCLDLPYIQKNSLAENFAITLWLSKLAIFISLVDCFERNWLVKN